MKKKDKRTGNQVKKGSRFSYERCIKIILRMFMKNKNVTTSCVCELCVDGLWGGDHFALINQPGSIMENPCSSARYLSPYGEKKGEKIGTKAAPSNVFFRATILLFQLHIVLYINSVIYIRLRVSSPAPILYYS
jgi:hypothetical protein